MSSVIDDAMQARGATTHQGQATLELVHHDLQRAPVDVVPAHTQARMRDATGEYRKRGQKGTRPTITARAKRQAGTQHGGWSPYDELLAG